MVGEKVILCACGLNLKVLNEEITIVSMSA